MDLKEISAGVYVHPDFPTVAAGTRVSIPSCVSLADMRRGFGFPYSNKRARVVEALDSPGQYIHFIAAGGYLARVCKTDVEISNDGGVTFSPLLALDDPWVDGTAKVIQGRTLYVTGMDGSTRRIDRCMMDGFVLLGYENDVLRRIELADWCAFKVA